MSGDRPRSEPPPDPGAGQDAGQDAGRDCRDVLTAAKLWLVSEPPAGPGTGAARDLPYLAHALFALVPVVSSEVPRMSVDEQWRLYVNPSWVLATPLPDVAAELAHQTWHLLLDHADRARSLGVRASTAPAWDDAADLTVGATLAADWLAPAHLPTPERLGQPRGLAAEEYFARLSRLPPPQDGEAEVSLPPEAGCGSGCDGVPRRHELPPDVDAAEGPGGVDAEDARQIRRRVAVDYRGHVTSRGTEPGDAWRWATELLEPRIAWEPLLAGAVRRAVGWVAGRAEYTHARPSRRQVAVPGVVLPGLRRPVPTVAMVVDTSGSVDDALLGRALGEVEGALAALGVRGSGVTVLSCDAAVQTVSHVRRARDVRLAGGGGTDLRVGLRAAEALRPRPDLVVVLTDGYTPWPAEPPPGSVVVVALLARRGHSRPPTPAWATRVECSLD